MISTSNLEIDKLLKNDYLNVKISIPGKKTLRAIMTGNFGFSLGNTWNNLASIDAIPFMDTIGSVANIAASIMGGSQVSLQSLWMTSAAWNGSEMPMFQLPIVIPTYSRQINPLDSLLFLAQGTLPPTNSYDWSHATNNEELNQLFKDLQSNISQGAASFGDFISTIGSDTSTMEIKESEAGYTYKTETGKYFGTMTRNMFLEAPLGYGLLSQGNTLVEPKPGTTYTIQVGKWFRASELVISNISGISFSKECVTGGLPLLLEATVSFRPYQLPSYDTFKRYFLMSSSSSDRDTSSPSTKPISALEDIKDNPNLLSGDNTALETINRGVSAKFFDDMIIA